MKKKSKNKFGKKIFLLVRKGQKVLSQWGSYLLTWIDQKVTLIYFSRERERSITRIWDIKKITSLSILFLIMVFLSIHYLVTNQSRRQLLSQAEKENQKLDSQIEKLKERVETINHYQDRYSEQMLKIYEHFGDIGGSSIWEKAARNKDIELIRNTWNLQDIDWLNSPNDDRTLSTLEKINKSRIKVLLNLNQLGEIDQYMALAEKISDHIPTGWPIKNHQGYKTSGFGTRLSPFYGKREFHTGVDIAAATGHDLVATADGVVLFSGDKGAFGNVIIIRHDFGYRTIYAHNDVNLVKSGKRVKKNQVIAKVGNTGRSTGSHVHYEIRIGRQYVDPWPYIVAKF